MPSDRSNIGPRFVAVLDFIARWCAYIGAVLLLIMAAMIGYDVTMRKFFGRPTDWAVDFAQYIMAYATFLGAVYVLKLDAHIKIGILEDHLNPVWRRVLSTFTSVIGFFTSAVILWQSILATWDAYSHNIVIPRPIEVPKHSVLIIIPFASLLFMLYFAIKTAHGLWGERHDGTQKSDTEEVA